MPSDTYDPQAPSGPPPGPSRPLGQTAGMAAGMAAAVAVGVGALMLFPRPHPPAPAPAPRGAQRVAAAAPAPAPAPAQVAEAPAPAVEAAPPLRPRIAPPEPRRRVVIVAPEARPNEARSSETRPHAPPTVVAMRRPSGPCRAPRLEADRLVCRQPALAAQDRAMRAAYARALAAGAAGLEVDRDQARWREARDRASDERQLARLYARRTAELEAAARRPRRPGLFGGF
jgi:hypothetical protein